MIDVIETVCSQPKTYVMAVAGLVGALAWASYRIYMAKKKSPKTFKFDVKRILDTTWQSAVAGATAGIGMTCSAESILTAAVVGIGIDNIANKLKVSGVEVLNAVQWISKYAFKSK